MIRTRIFTAVLVAGGLTALASAATLDEFTDSQAGSLFGYAIANAGDVNSDGFDDILIGACYHDHDGYTNAGKVYLYSGRRPYDLLWSCARNMNEAHYGHSVIGVGDLNHDGYDDFCVGAMYENESDNNPERGRVYCYLGGESVQQGWATNRSLFADYEHLGSSLAVVPDQNGDGIDEIAAGGFGDNDPRVVRGRVRILSGADGSIIATLSLGPESGVDRFGGSIAAGADFNGDGTEDLAVGAFGYEYLGQNEAGTVLVFDGRTLYLGSDATMLAQYFSPQPERSGKFGVRVDFGPARFGLPGASLWVGAQEESAGAGRVYAFAYDVFDPSPRLTLEAPDGGGKFGHWIAARGTDVSGDRSPELVVGAKEASVNGLSKNGAIYVFDGHALDNPQSPQVVPVERIGGRADNVMLARAVGIPNLARAPETNVNDDATDELILGETTSTGVSKAFLYSLLPAVWLLGKASPGTTPTLEIQGVPTDQVFLLVSAGNLDSGLSLWRMVGNLWVDLASPVSLIIRIGGMMGDTLSLGLPIPDDAPPITLYLQTLHVREGLYGERGRFSNVVELSIQ
ncbi:MAG: integrin alpha [Planctomycetota bacterium]